MTTQTRPSPDQTVQQLASIPLATILALQIQTCTAADTMLGDKDIALCDATAAPFTLTLPSGNDVVLGKLYVVKETSVANIVTIDATGAGTIDGSANLALAAGEAVSLIATAVADITRLVTWQIVSQTAPNAGVGNLAIANNLSELVGAAAALAARTNIGANRLVVGISNLDFVPTNSPIARYVHRGPNATIVSVDAVSQHPTDGTVIVTTKIGATAVTNGVATIPLSVGVGGLSNAAAPTALRTVVAGDVVSFTVTGTNTLIAVGEVWMALLY